MITSVYGPYSVASDELTWVGSRENWGLLDNGDCPTRSTSTTTRRTHSRARRDGWRTTPSTGSRDSTKQERCATRLDLARTYVYAAVAYITIGDNYDDFVLASDRTKPAAPVGEANMVQMYDSAIVYLDRGLVIAKALSNTELQSQILGLRARAKYSAAVWRMLKPARTTPANPLSTTPARTPMRRQHWR